MSSCRSPVTELSARDFNRGRWVHRTDTDQLQTLCSMEMKVDGGGSCLRISQPSAPAQALLKALDLRLPEALPHHPVRVVTRKKLPERRKPR